MQHYTTQCGLNITYKLKSSARRTIGFHITPQGLEIRTPHNLPKRTLQEAIEEKKEWLRKNLQELENQQKWWRSKEEVWRDGECFPLLGRPVRILSTYILGVMPLPDANPKTIETLAIPECSDYTEVYHYCRHWLRAQAEVIFNKRLQALSQAHGLNYKRLTLGWSKRTWGWCKSDGSIMLNWRLIHYPLPIIDYIAAHELTHLVHMHHGPEFWQYLKGIYPDYEAAKQDLSHYQPSCVPNFEPLWVQQQ